MVVEVASLITGSFSEALESCTDELFSGRESPPHPQRMSNDRLRKWKGKFFNLGRNNLVYANK
jgi:hypothetical protein